MFIDLIFGDRIWRLLSLWNKMVNEYFYILVLHVTDLEKCSSVGKESPCSAGDPGLIPGLGRSPGEGKGNPLQYPCLGNSWTEEPGGLQSLGSQRVRHD